MKRILKKLIKGIPVYLALRIIKQRWKQKRKLKEWERHGKPIPPPHIVKQHTIREFADRFGIKILIETGTYRGKMIQAMGKYFSRIYSIELNSELYQQAKQKFVSNNKVKIIHGDSGIELKKLIPALDQAALFWLDGHYSEGVTAKGNKDTPIYEELAAIFSSSLLREHVILIDDARLFGTDPAYPSIDELSQLIKAKNSNVRIEIKNDIIRISPLFLS